MKKTRNILYSKRIFRKLIIFLVGVSITPMILVTGILLYRYSYFSRELVHARLEELVLGYKHHIDFSLFEKSSNIRHLARAFEPGAFKDNHFLNKKLQEFQEEYSIDFLDLELIDENGLRVAHAGLSGMSTDHSNSLWFKEALANKHFISDVFIGTKKEPLCIIATRIQEKDAQWILKATFDFGYFTSLMENLTSGKTGKAFIINQKGEYQTRPPGKVGASKQFYLSLFENLSQTDNNHKPDKGIHGSDSENWYIIKPFDQNAMISHAMAKGRDKEIIMVSAFLKNNDWMLVFQQDVDEAFADLIFSRKISAIIFLLGSLGIILACFLLFRRIHRFISEINEEKDLVMTQQIIETGKLDSIGELATGIAHEINNPVAIMVEEAGWVQDLLHEGIDKNGNMEEFIRALKQIETQGRRCKEITRKLLHFGRKSDSRIEKLQVNEIIEDMVSLASEKARHANATIVTSLDPDLPEIQASFSDMQQVLSNIINNGLEAMEMKGDRLDIISSCNKEYITITVKDNGPGIAAINLNRVFDPFFSTKPVGKGSGLGLSICYGIIKKMGGRIDFESMEGEGSAFHIVLPLDNSLKY